MYAEIKTSCLNVVRQEIPQGEGIFKMSPSDFETNYEKNEDNQARAETARGLRYCHKRINANTSKSLESASFLYAIVELLAEKDLITIEELDERKKTIANRLVQNFKKNGFGLMYQDPELDKYRSMSK